MSKDTPKNSGFKLLPILFGIVLLSSTAMANGEVKDGRLACYFYDRADVHFGASVFSSGLPWVWAKGLAEEQVYISGIEQDGFLRIERIQGKVKGFFGLRVVANYENSDSLAKAFCERGIRSAYPGSHSTKELVYFGAKLGFLSFKYMPVVLKYYNNQYLKKIDKLVVFGDSLSDQGNLKNLLRISPRDPYFAGRFSNSFIWVDYLQRLTSVGVQNWAYGGSMSNSYIDLNFNNHSLLQKVAHSSKAALSGNMKEEISRYQRSLDGQVIVNADSTLFSIWTGGNDYISIIENEGDADTFLDFPDDQRIGSKIVIHRVTENIILNIKKLFDMGARNFLVANLPDLGKIPFVLADNAYHKSLYLPKEEMVVHLSQKMSSLSAAHNVVLRQKLNKLKERLDNINIIHVDTGNTLDDIVNQVHLLDRQRYLDYDLDQNLIQRVSHKEQRVQVHRSCYAGGLTSMSGIKDTCPNVDRALFWDRLHPTSFGHCLFASLFHHSMAESGVLNAASVEDYLSMCRPEL